MVGSADRISRAYDWWLTTSPEGRPPSVSDWKQLVRGLDAIAEDADAPQAVRTALVVAKDRTVRTWAIIERCLYAAIYGHGDYLPEKKP